MTRCRDYGNEQDEAQGRLADGQGRLQPPDRDGEAGGRPSLEHRAGSVYAPWQNANRCALEIPLYRA